MSGDTNYPPGVTGAEPAIAGPARDEDPPCADCGHGLDVHDEDGRCAATLHDGTWRHFAECPCEEYIPFDEEDPYGY